MDTIVELDAIGQEMGQGWTDAGVLEAQTTHTKLHRRQTRMYTMWLCTMETRRRTLLGMQRLKGTTLENNTLDTTSNA